MQRPQAAAPRKPQGFDPRWLPLIVTTVGAFMSVLDSTIVHIALPSILDEFSADLDRGQLVITSYLMALAVVVPVSGFLGERVGMKRLYMITLVCFTAGSALCGLAWNLESLVVFRVLQGLGGGMLQPLGMALVFTMITPLERPYFMGLLGIPVLLGPLLGPSLGGYLTEYWSWRAIFLVNVPFGTLDVLLAYLLLKETPIRATAKLDVRGFALSSIAFPCLVLGLSLAGDGEWGSPIVWALLVAGAAALLAFIRVELGQRDPMLQLRLFATPMFRLAVSVQWIGFFSLFGLTYLTPLFLQRVHGWGAAETGLALLPMGAVAFLAMNLSGRAYHRIGPRPLVLAGLAALAITTFLWTQIDNETNRVVIMLIVAGRGLGLGLFSQTVQMVAYNTVPDGQMPRATALMNVGMRVNGALSTAVLTAILIVGLRIAGAPGGASITGSTAPTDTMLDAFGYAFLAMTALSLIGAILAFFLHDQALVRWREDRDRAPEAEVRVGEPEAETAG